MATRTVALRPFAVAWATSVVQRLVTGTRNPWPGGWPLPAAGGRRRPVAGAARPCLPSAVGSESETKRAEPALFRSLRTETSACLQRIVGLCPRFAPDQLFELPRRVVMFI